MVKLMGTFSHYLEIFNVIVIYAVCYGCTSYNMKESRHVTQVHIL